MAEDVFSIAAENQELLRIAKSDVPEFSTLDSLWDYTRDGIMHHKISSAGRVVVTTHITGLNENNRRARKGNHE